MYIYKYLCIDTYLMITECVILRNLPICDFVMKKNST